MTEVTRYHLRILDNADNPAADVARLILRHEGEFPVADETTDSVVAD